MHELSIAQSLLESAVDAAKKSGAKKIKSIETEIGDLLMVNPQQLRFAMEIISKGTIAEGAKLKMRRKRVKVKCKEGHVSTIHASLVRPLISCSKCQSQDLEIIEGRDLILKRIEAE